MENPGYLDYPCNTDYYNFVLYSVSVDVYLSSNRAVARTNNLRCVRYVLI